MRVHNGTLFEGNAQTFRILTFVEPKVFGKTSAGGVRWVGLDLTRASLRAILKYPIVEQPEMVGKTHPKFGAYREPLDEEYFSWVWDGERSIKNLAAEIMDIADEMAYGVHDFEDGVWAGMIPIRELVRGESARESLHGRALRLSTARTPDLEAFEGAVERVIPADSLEYIADFGFDRSRTARAELKNLTARLIGRFIEAVEVDGRYVGPDADTELELLALKAMAWEWMIERTDIETSKFGQRRLVERVFDGYWERPEMLPRREDWLEVLETSGPFWRVGDERWPEKARMICDHVAGMTDSYAREVYDQMYRATERRDLRLAY
jgi:dGTPase